MKRKDFLKAGILAGMGLATKGADAAAIMLNNNDELKPFEPVGFNHIPNNTSKVAANMVLHKANTRGGADHGWLKTKHTFSFANYYNPERMNFGVLRVLNDDIITGGSGFPTHPHDNMEIISIPLFGDLEHKDSMGNVSVIKQFDIQAMTAGTGIKHSEYNKNISKEAHFLQIWLFPRKAGLKPSYDQKTFKPESRENKLEVIVSPEGKDGGISIHQDAWFSMGRLQKGKSAQYNLKRKGNGVYAFVIEGSVTINGQALDKRDGLGIWDVNQLNIKTTNGCELLLMDVPMQIG
ncbi:MAG: pirin family protein [Bacteroidota bacterium]